MIFELLVGLSFFIRIFMLRFFVGYEFFIRNSFVDIVIEPILHMVTYYIVNVALEFNKGVLRNLIYISIYWVNVFILMIIAYLVNVKLSVQ